MVFSLQRELSQQRLTFNKRDIPTMTFSSERHPPYNAHLLMKATFSQMSSPFITGVVETLTTEKKKCKLQTCSVYLFGCFCLFFCQSVIFILFYRLFHFLLSKTNQKKILSHFHHRIWKWSKYTNSSDETFKLQGLMGFGIWNMWARSTQFSY